MLNIPESVKTLFKTDGTHKNFRAHFPNGEFPDITNENIVRESLTITESICSQDVFKFGLAEASVLEFETVGIGNMYGMTIQASIEIDLSSLTAAEIAEIEAGSWDGEYVSAAASDLGFAFFRVPLGVFRVEKCPRNHGAMTHRQVEAYSLISTPTSPVMQWRLNQVPSSENKLTYDSLMDFISANYGYTYPQYVSDNYTSTAGSFVDNSDAHGFFSHRYVWETDRAGELRLSGRVYAKQFDHQQNQEYVISVTRGNFDGSPFVDQLLSALAALGITDEEKVTEIKDFANYLACVQFIKGGYSYGYDWYGSDLARPQYAITGDVPIMILDKGGNAPDFVFPESIFIQWQYSRYDQPTQNGSFTFTFETTSPPTVDILTRSGTDINTPITISATSNFRQGGTTWYMFADSTDLKTLLNGYMETIGVFGKMSRNGQIEFAALDPSSSISVLPGNYESVWWDEYDVSPIGTVVVTSADEKNEENTRNITIGTGSSIYDATGNELLKVLNLTAADVVALFNGEFATHAKNAGFTPIEATMQGWPWLEAGDALQITAEDGTVVNTYALRVEMSGVQHLMATITAEGGEIVGET